MPGDAYATAHYECACCAAAWSESWPAALPLGPHWRDHDPVHWTAGCGDVPRFTAADADPLAG